MRDLPALALLSLALGVSGCGPSTQCSGADAVFPPQGSPADVHPLTRDAGFFLVGPNDAGLVQVTSSGPAMPRLCEGSNDAGTSEVVFPDGGHDFFYGDGGRVEADAGCRRTDALNQALMGALGPLGFGIGEELVRADGTTVLSYGFRDWGKVDQAVQLTGALLVDAGMGGPIELHPVTEYGGKCL